jgi:hypothetical protein
MFGPVQRYSNFFLGPDPKWIVYCLLVGQGMILREKFGFSN